MKEQICEMLITLLNDDHGISKSGYFALEEFILNIDNSIEIQEIFNATSCNEDRVYLDESYINCITYEQFKKKLEEDE